MLQIPHLTTDRLLLRGFLPDDFEAYARMMADPDVTRYLGAVAAETVEFFGAPSVLYRYPPG